MDIYSAYAGTDLDRQRYWDEIVMKVENNLKKTVISRFLTTTTVEQGKPVSHKKEEYNSSFKFRDPRALVEKTVKETAIYLMDIYDNGQEKVAICADDSGDEYYPSEYYNKNLISISLADIARRQVDFDSAMPASLTRVFTKCEQINFKLLLDKAVAVTGQELVLGKKEKIRSFFSKTGILGRIANIIKDLNNTRAMFYILCSRAAMTRFELYLYLHGSERAGKAFSTFEFFGMKIIPVDDLGFMSTPVFPDNELYFIDGRSIGYKDIISPIRAIPADHFLEGKCDYGELFFNIEAMSIDRIKSIYKLTIK